MSKQKNVGIGAGASRFAMNKSSQDASAKLSSDIMGGKTAAKDFFYMPCSALKEFTLKSEYDFSPWPEEKFEDLILSIKEYGVLHPIIIRPIEDNDGFYEILAGEHRWKASQKLGIETIPAHLIGNCTDEHAKAIFTLTNIINRELTLEDKINGWSHYYESIRGKAEDTIKSLVEQGILPVVEEKEVSKRQMLRFYKINKLHSALKKLVFDSTISLVAGEELAILSTEEQALLAQYDEEITSTKHAKMVLLLKAGEIEEYEFNEEGLEFIFSKKTTHHKENSFAFVLQNVKPVLKEILDKDEYIHSPRILTEALTIYKTYNGRSDLMKKAMDEYLTNHPEEAEKLGGYQN